MASRAETSLCRRLDWWIVVAVAARHAVGLWQLRRALATIDRPNCPEPSADDLVLHIVIPVLREQQHIRAAVEWFADLLRHLPRSTVTFVTTERERREREAHRPRTHPFHLSNEEVSVGRVSRGGPPLTGQVLARELDQPAVRDLPIRHIHYSGDGRKAAQVNHAVEHLPRDGGTAYVAVYDIDSRPDLALLRRTAAFIRQRAQADGEPPAVIQQSARFAAPDTDSRAWEPALCQGAARLQTLWTLRREVPSFHRYARAVRRPSGFEWADALARGLAQTVGHGLLVRLDVFRRVGGLPTFTALDDLPFGYRLTVEQIPVDSLPFTTQADAPGTLRELLSQGERWFHNYLDYPRCAAQSRAADHGSAAGRALALGTGAYRGASWLLRSPSTLACLVIAARRASPWPVRLAALGGLWLGQIAPVSALAKAEDRRLTMRQHGRESLELLAAYLISSIGPAAAIARRAAGAGGPIAPKSNRPATAEEEH
ncbi:glycosyltransferase family protein [Streptosporangium soli]|nr:hypothetical protein [Streptosporangium sp. KLBMP 9127]